ncbi:cytidylyltransferase domain-containing protein [Streptomyces sp. CA-294286]|uniref:cytidylyltransferase domain-containing protein n=1 Tax=Streptomyces sp. CA-294286 TaxID=3240070 RepID=UPI003D8B2193
MERARRVLAVIPARGGSKGVPGKNLAPVGGVPLVVRAVRACLAAGHVTEVVVSTDDDAIAAAALAAGAEVVVRPGSLAGDTASSEAAVLHALDALDVRADEPGTVLLVQCTSPFVTGEDVDGVARAVLDGADTAVTVAAFHGFVWREEGAEQDAPGATPAVTPPTGSDSAAPAVTPAPGSDGATPAVTPPPGSEGAAPADPPPPGARNGTGVNHDKATRPRRQDRPEDLLETGAAYAMDVAGFRRHRHRFFGRTALVRTDPARVLEVDDPRDLERARALAPLLDTAGLPTRGDVDAVVLDFDGTQTDDRVLIDAEGRETVAVHRGDGLGIAALRDAGILLLILSTEQNPVVAARARKLRIPVLHGVDRKDLALKQWCAEQSVDPSRVLYVGNDVNDLPCFALAGWPVAVADAHGSVRAAARATTRTPGGHGAVREVATWLLGPNLHSPTPLPPTPEPLLSDPTPLLSTPAPHPVPTAHSTRTPLNTL